MRGGGEERPLGGCAVDGRTAVCLPDQQNGETGLVGLVVERLVWRTAVSPCAEKLLESV